MLDDGPVWQNFVIVLSTTLTLEGIDGGAQIDPLFELFDFKFCCLTDYHKLWSNCSLFVNTSYDAN